MTSHFGDDQNRKLIEKCQAGADYFLSQKGEQRFDPHRPFVVLHSTNSRFRVNKTHNSYQKDDDQDDCSSKMEFLFLEFDILIAADGTKSLVRRSASTSSSFNYQPVTQFSLLPSTKPSLSFPKPVSRDKTKKLKGEKEGGIARERTLNGTSIISVPELRQTAIIVNFKSEFGRCPEMKKRDGEAIDPWEVGFRLSEFGVHSVFKRFYHSHCQIQILMLHHEGEEIYHMFKGSSSTRQALDSHDESLPLIDDSQTNRTTDIKDFNYIEAQLSEDLQENVDDYWSNLSQQTNLFHYSKKKERKQEKKIESTKTQKSECEGTDPTHWQGIPWELIRRVVNEILERRVENVEELRSLLVSQDTQTEGLCSRTYDIKVVHLKLLQTQNLFLCYPISCERMNKQSAEVRKVEHDGHSLNTKVQNRTGVILVVGDAVRSSYFRLGIGVNNIFSSLESLDQLFWFIKQFSTQQLYFPQDLDESQSKTVLYQYLDLYQKREQERTVEIVDAQVRTMFYESYCGLVVGFEDPTQPFRSIILNRRAISSSSPSFPSFSYSRITSLAELLSLECLQNRTFF